MQSDSNSPEEWRAIIGFENIYEVSNHGRIRRLHSPTKKPRSPEGLLVPGKAPNGYLRVSLYRDGQRPKQYGVHRLVALAFLEPPFKGAHTNHKNGIKTDNRRENLEWMTGSENQLHAIRNGLYRQVRGSGVPQAKLTEADIPRIRALSSRLSATRIAPLFGVTRRAIDRVLDGTSWRHVP